MTRNMDIAILGAGAMGSLFGGLLAEADHRVTLVDVDQAHLDSIRREGLHVTTDAGARAVTNLSVTRTEDVVDAPELLIVFTKTFHTQKALAAAPMLIGRNTFVLSLQNGLGNVERIAQYVPLECVMVGMTTWPADKSVPGQVASHGTGAIRLMSADGGAQDVVARTVEALNSADLNCTADPNIWSAIWEKVAFNAALNGLCAITRCAVGELANVDGQALAGRIVEEVTDVAQASGVAVDPGHIIETVEHALAHHREHRPSMLQDVLAGRKTEIEAINGEVVVRARELGIDVPCTQAVLHLVRLIENRSVVA